MRMFSQSDKIATSMSRREKILIFGSSGQIGSRAVELLSTKFELICPTHQEVDVSRKERIEEFIDQVKPAQILYCVGFTNIDRAQEEFKEAFLLNAGAVHYITQRARSLHIPFHYLSTEVVFDGKKKDQPYTEDDFPNPLSVCGLTKRGGELVTLAASKNNSVLRLIICYSAKYRRKKDLARLALSKIKQGEKFRATHNQEINPIYVDHLIYAIEVILKNHACGIYHLGATDHTTPYEFARKIARRLNLDDSLIKPISFEEFSKGRPEKRPQHEWLDVSKFQKDFGKGILRSVDEGIDSFVRSYLK